jgi:hypothetical protein
VTGLSEVDLAPGANAAVFLRYSRAQGEDVAVGLEDAARPTKSRDASRQMLRQIRCCWRHQSQPGSGPLFVALRSLAVVMTTPNRIFSPAGPRLLGLSGGIRFHIQLGLPLVAQDRCEVRRSGMHKRLSQGEIDRSTGICLIQCTCCALFIVAIMDP